MLRPVLIAAILSSIPACTEVRFRENHLQVDSFVQTALPRVDILWVVDNSGTMREEQTKLGQEFDRFISRLLDSGADYQIGIISTDTDDPAHSGRLQGEPKVISREVADPKAVFMANVRLPETVNLTERGLDAIRLALSPALLSEHNQGFFRPEASLFVIVVSDEDDHSLGPTRFYSRLLENIKGAGNDNLVSLSAIVGQPPCGCGRDCSQPFHGVGAEAGVRYLEVQEQTRGLFHSICQENYGPIVDELGINAAGLRRRFHLSRIPDPNTLSVTNYGANDPACQKMAECPDDLVCTSGHRCGQGLPLLEGSSAKWVYEKDDNTVFFSNDFLPAAGSTIEVSYFRSDS